MIIKQQLQRRLVKTTSQWQMRSSNQSLEPQTTITLIRNLDTWEQPIFLKRDSQRYKELTNSTHQLEELSTVTKNLKITANPLKWLTKETDKDQIYLERPTGTTTKLKVATAATVTARERCKHILQLEITEIFQDGSDLNEINIYQDDQIC